jgi:DNA-binding transcriptional regulator YiaG
MNPIEFKAIRTKIELTQQDLAEILGVSHQMVIGHYESGFRKPGRLIQIVMSIMGSLPNKKRKEFVELLKEHGRRVEATSRRVNRG